MDYRITVGCCTALSTGYNFTSECGERVHTVRPRRMDTIIQFRKKKYEKGPFKKKVAKKQNEKEFFGFFPVCLQSRVRS